MQARKIRYGVNGLTKTWGHRPMSATFNVIRPSPPLCKIFFSSKKKAAKFKKRIPKPFINWDLFTWLACFWADAVFDNIDESTILRDSAKKAEDSRVTKDHCLTKSSSWFTSMELGATGNY
ncbi:hypothetical protein ANCCAN_11176 [Ancylostoma caninum]|uniref:Uncharacterized protein n=1 Tax=Ancylostoma caninum TaxID=29170 RepID=A0A368GIG0_ANCCA|nr:hypothetical protein ANCCAN_11176 [Ancylostoma caninum]